MGKTAQLVNVSAVTGYPIVTFSKQGVDYIKEQSKRYDCNIPEPVTFEEMMAMEKRGDRMYDNVLVDNVECGGLLGKALNTYLNTNVVACTCSPDYIEEQWENFASNHDGRTQVNLTVTC